MKNFIISILIVAALAFVAVGQDKTTGGVKGNVRNTSGKSVAGVTIEARQEGKTVVTAQSNAKGDFALSNLKPGVYRFVFIKTGLSEGVSQNIEVKAGNVVTLKKLVMGVDAGTLAIVRGSVFDVNGRSVKGAKIEIAKISGDGTKRISETYSNDGGEFGFRLQPDNARYRLTVSIKGAETAAKDLDIDGGAQVYRTVVTLKSNKTN
jgi:hypothetical protein